jgi:hypothetical protein
VPSPTFAFDGLTPWAPDAGLIACEVGPWLLDLHNFAAFLGYSFRVDALLTLAWYHHQPSIGPPTPNLVMLDFADVRNFKVEQARDWDVRCSDDTYGWDYWPDDEGRAALTFDVADSELSFSASGVRLRLVPSEVHRAFG